MLRGGEAQSTCFVCNNVAHHNGREIPMPSIKVDYESYKGIIGEWMRQNVPFDAMVLDLRLRFGLEATSITLRRRCKEWGFQSKTSQTHSDDVVAFISERYHYSFDTDLDISNALQSRDIDIPIKHVQVLRLERKWKRRPANKGDIVVQQQKTNEQVQKVIDEGVVQQYGRQFLQDTLHVDSIHISHDQVNNTLHTIDLEGVAIQTRPMEKRTQGFY